MAHFYGMVSGQAKTAATRRGSKKAGLRTVAASWSGAVETVLLHQDGKDIAEVRLIPWHGKGVTRVLYRGEVNAEEAKQITNHRLPSHSARRLAIPA